MHARGPWSAEPHKQCDGPIAIANKNTSQLAIKLPYTSKRQINNAEHCVSEQPTP